MDIRKIDRFYILFFNNKPINNIKALYNNNKYYILDEELLSYDDNTINGKPILTYVFGDFRSISNDNYIAIMDLESDRKTVYSLEPNKLIYQNKPPIVDNPAYTSFLDKFPYIRVFSEVNNILILLTNKYLIYQTSSDVFILDFKNNIEQKYFKNFTTLYRAINNNYLYLYNKDRFSLIINNEYIYDIRDIINTKDLYPMFNNIKLLNNLILLNII